MLKLSFDKDVNWSTGLETGDTKPFWKYVRSQKQEHFGIKALRNVAYGFCVVVGFYYLLSIVELLSVFSPGYALCSSYLKFSRRVRTQQFNRCLVSSLFCFEKVFVP